MFIDKWKPVFAPDAEVGADTGADTGTGGAPPAEAPVPMNERPADGPGSGRGTLRKQLEANVEKVRKSEERVAKKPPQSRAREMGLGGGAQEGEEAEEVAATPQEEGDAQPQIKPPEGWTKEAKAAWEQLPQPVQAAVAKREADMAKGVDDLKKKQAEIDEVLAPRMQIIRGHGHTPAQAVNQLFAWFEALSANPNVAFPALANSFKFDLRQLPGMQQQPQQQAPQQQPPVVPGQTPPAGDIPPYVKSLEQKIQELQQGFGQQFGQLNNIFQQQSQQKIEENLALWAKDKPYYEEVRKTMGQLIQSQAVAPLPNGNADLDRAYDMALYALPEVRAKVLADQRQKEQAAAKLKADTEKKAQQEQAEKARRAGISLTGSAPGAPSAGQPAKKKGKSVRESIMEARQELGE